MPHEAVLVLRSCLNEVQKAKGLMKDEKGTCMLASCLLTVSIIAMKKLNLTHMLMYYLLQITATWLCVLFVIIFENF